MKHNLYRILKNWRLLSGVITIRQNVNFVLLALFFSFSIPSYSITDALKLKIQNSTHSDETIVRFLSGATDGFDSSYDAWKFFSANPLVPSIYSKIDSSSCLSINALPSLYQDRDIIVFSSVGAIGNYTITSTEIGLFPSNVSIFLEDTEMGINIDIRTCNVYSFNVSDTAIYNANKSRFKLHFSVLMPTATSNFFPMEIATYYSNNSISVKYKSEIKFIKVYDITGKIIVEQKNINSIETSIPFNEIANIYIIEINGDYRKKIVNY